MLAYALNERMARKAEYLREENRVLKEALRAATGKKRIPLSDEQRRRLAAKGKALTPAEREECCQIVRPSTILDWFRQLVTRKYDSSQIRRPGRPRKPNDIRKLVVRIATENPGWGYTKIRDALRGLKIEIARTTVANILKRHGIEPAPERGKRTSWRTFLRAHWDVMAATDFFTIEVWTPRGLVTYYVLFVIHLGTRKVWLAGATPNPTGAFMPQVARNLTDEFDGFLRNHRYLIMDRDTKFTEASRNALEREGVEPVRCPPRAPTCNAYAERFVRSIKEECLDPMILLGERSLRHALREYEIHYLQERNHQGLDNQLLEPPKVVPSHTQAVQRRERLGGILSFYHCEAA